MTIWSRHHSTIWPTRVNRISLDWGTKQLESFCSWLDASGVSQAQGSKMHHPCCLGNKKARLRWSTQWSFSTSFWSSTWYDHGTADPITALLGFACLENTPHRKCICLVWLSGAAKKARRSVALEYLPYCSQPMNPSQSLIGEAPHRVNVEVRRADAYRGCLV